MVLSRAGACLVVGLADKVPWLTYTYVRFRQGFVDAVKIEGGRDRASTVSKIVRGGVAVMGHVGLTPQAISVLGGFRAQGR